MHNTPNSNAPKLWHRLKEFATLCFCVSILSGCTLMEEVEIEILYAPQMHSHFNAADAAVGIKSATIFIFDTQDILVKDTLLDEKTLNSNEIVEIVRGIAEGSYSMLTFYNVGGLNLAQYTIGTTKIDDILISLPSQNPDQSVESKSVKATNILVDSLCYSLKLFNLARGEKTEIDDLSILRAHYKVTLSITGLSRVTSDLGEITVQMLGIPSSINGRLSSQNSFSEFIPLSFVNDDELRGEYMSLLFDEKNKASLKIYEDGVLVQTIALLPEEYEDSQSSNRLDISIQFDANSYIIIVNNWVVGEFEIIDMGS